MKVLKFIPMILLAGLFACTAVQTVQKIERPSDAPVSMYMHRDKAGLNIDVLIPVKGWEYTSVLSDDGMHYTLVVKNLTRKLGAVDIIRPVLSYKAKQYPSGFKATFDLANRNRLDTYRNESGLHIKLTSLEPDMEAYSMENFGGWADPVKPADSFQGAVEKDGVTEISFDAPADYSEGEAGGRYYLDIYNVKILPGIIKHKGLLETVLSDNKTRLIFKNRQQVCPDDRTLTIGRACAGYSGLSGFKREVTDASESFEFNLHGTPDSVEKTAEGLTAFGFKNTRLFSSVFQRYSGGVYKVEARERDGILWLIFLHDKNLKYRKYYSGDKFFAAFYRGGS